MPEWLQGFLWFLALLVLGFIFGPLVLVAAIFRGMDSSEE
jgi:hypothetical protein